MRGWAREVYEREIWTEGICAKGMGGEVLEGGGEAGGGGSGTQKFAYQEWPNKIFPIVSLSCFCRGGGSRGGVTPSYYSVRPF